MDQCVATYRQHILAVYNMAAHDRRRLAKRRRSGFICRASVERGTGSLDCLTQRCPVRFLGDNGAMELCPLCRETWYRQISVGLDVLYVGTHVKGNAGNIAGGHDSFGLLAVGAL